MKRKTAKKKVNVYLVPNATGSWSVVCHPNICLSSRANKTLAGAKRMAIAWVKATLTGNPKIRFIRVKP